jgi:hypothetical protein
MKLKTKILLLNLVIFVILTILLLTAEHTLKLKFENTFKKETENLFFVIEDLLNQYNNRVARSLNAVFADINIKINFQLKIEDKIKELTEKYLNGEDIKLIAYFNQDNSLYKYFSVSSLSKVKAEKLLEKIKTLNSGENRFINIQNGIYLISKRNLYINYKSGSIAVAVPYPSDSFFNDILTMCNAGIFATIWSNNKLLGGNYHLLYSEK